MSKRRATRRERIRRNQRFTCLLIAAVGAVVLTFVAKNEQRTELTVEPEVVVVEAVPAPSPIEIETDEEPTAVRDDIPLDEETQLLLYKACDETGIQYELALAVVWKETNFRNITGDNGASSGYMQVQSRWHTGRMERLGVTDLADPYGNFLVGCDYLAELLGKDRGLEWALMAYNGGPSYANKMEKAEKVSQYAQKVLNYMNDLGGI